MTDNFLSLEERETLNALQAKQKRIQRAEKAEKKFMAEVDARKDDIMTHWGITHASDGKWSDIIKKFGSSDEDDLFSFITSDAVLKAYRARRLGGVQGSAASLPLGELNTCGAPTE